MNKGEIWIVAFPDSHGREQTGIRPVIVLARAEADIVLVVPCTSNVQALRFPNTLEIEPSKKNGFHELTIALIFQLRAIDKTRMKYKLGEVEENVLNEIDHSIRLLLQL